MLQGYIVDPESGKVVAVIRHGEVFRNGKEGAKIATVLNANLYDLSGNLVGRLDGPHAIDVRTWSLPIAVRNLLEGETPQLSQPVDKPPSGPQWVHEIKLDGFRMAARIDNGRV
jgi:ATP-dependent DNA ligase